MNQEMRFDINALARVKQTARGKLPCSRGSSAPWLCDDLDVGNRGGRSKGEGICVYIQLIHSRN